MLSFNRQLIDFGCNWCDILQSEEIEEDDEEEELQNVSVNNYRVVELCNKFPGTSL